MEKLQIIQLLTILILSIIFILLAVLFVRFFFAIKFKKRVQKYYIKNNNLTSKSVIDKLALILLKLIKKISKFISKSVILVNYSKRLDKYLIYNKNNDLKSIDYISLKILYMLFISFLYILMSCLKKININMFLLIIIAFASFFMIDIILIIIYKQKRNTIESGLLQAIVIMNSAFKSGKNIWEAINIVKTSLSSPIKEEFEIISKDLSYGLELTNVFERFYDRVKVEEIKYITSSLTLLNKTGGNIVSVFNMIEKHFYDKLKIKNELNSLTSSSKMLYRILIFIPFIFILVIYSLNPSYFAPLLTTKIGLLLDLLMVIIYALYVIIIKKITKVEKI